MADELLEGESPSSDVPQRLGESRRVGIGALVESERLFVEIPEQVEWLYADVCATNRALQ